MPAKFLEELQKKFILTKFANTYYYKMLNKVSKTVPCFSPSNLSLMSEAIVGIWEIQPLKIVANLDLLNTWILPFWRFKRANLKGCDSEK